MAEEVPGEQASPKKPPAILGRIETLQKERGWSRRELSRQSEVSPDTVNGWFYRGGSPAAEDAYAIAVALGTTVEYLVTGRNPEPPEPEWTCPEQAQLIDWIRGMDLSDAIKAWSVAVTGINTHGLPQMPPARQGKKEKRAG